MNVGTLFIVSLVLGMSVRHALATAVDDINSDPSVPMGIKKPYGA